MSKYHEAGKGSKRRPGTGYGKGWEAIFGERCIKHRTTPRPCPECDVPHERIVVDGKQLWRPLNRKDSNK